MVTPRPAAEPTGWGIGFYQGGEVLHKKRPRLEGAGPAWQQEAEDIRSDCVLMHLRQPTVGDFRAQNTHPFRMRQWIFAHIGTIPRFSAIRPRIYDSLPDFLQRNIRGTTDSEAFFHLILSFLHDAGQLANPDIDDRHGLAAIRSAAALIDRLGAEIGTPPSTLNSVLTNGRKMFAFRRGAPMALVRRTGFHDPRPGTPPTEASAGSLLRYVMIVSDGPETPRDWEDMAPDSIAVIDRNLDVTLYPARPH